MWRLARTRVTGCSTSSTSRSTSETGSRHDGACAPARTFLTRDITQVRAASARADFDKPVDVWVDGRRVGDATAIAVRVTGELVDIVV